MPDKPAAEVEITAPLVRDLVLSQAPRFAPDAEIGLDHEADGWDCSVWRLGRDLAVRLPRRALAAPLVLHEQRVLPELARLLAPTGLGVPEPLACGRPGYGYPWSWSIVPWFSGARGLDTSLRSRTGWVDRLAAALCALHVPAAPDHPVNPVRGVPLAMRARAVRGRIASLQGRIADEELSGLTGLWDAALQVPRWSGPPLWIHGDLHPGNLIAREEELIAMIDFGDVTGGDPAYDLSVAWTAFDQSARTRFRSLLGDRYDDAAWVRARGWAAAVALMLLDQSDDNPPYAALGVQTVRELLSSDN